MTHLHRGVLRSGSTMHKCIWSECRFSGIARVNKPARTLTNRHRVSGTQLHEQIVRVLSVDQWLAFVRLTSLKQKRRATGRKGKRFSAEHSAQFESALSRNPLASQSSSKPSTSVTGHLLA